MSDTQVLLSKIAALRQQLEQVQGLAQDGGSAPGAPPGEATDSAWRLQRLERQAKGGVQEHALLDTALRPMAPTPSPASACLPRQLTARARRILEEGRVLLGQLRLLADAFEPAPEAGYAVGPAAADPLTHRYHQTTAMADTALRLIQTFPDAPSAQLRLCEGIEAMLGIVAERVAALSAAVEQRRQQDLQIETLAGLLTELQLGRSVDLQAFVALAAPLVQEAEDSAALRFLHASPEQPARFIACHSLTVAQVMARLAAHSTELRNEPVEAVLAALVHDVGMLEVPSAILVKPGALDDSERRTVEAHARLGAEILTRCYPRAAYLADAAAGHHERLDGTGYPAGLRDKQIGPLNGLLAVCDVYAALCAPRPHRAALDTRTALTDTLLLAEEGRLDRYQAERLLQLSFYPVGSVVELADGAIGLVVATPMGRRDLNAPARPVLALLTDSQGMPLPNPWHVDLAQCTGRASCARCRPGSVERSSEGSIRNWFNRF